MQRELGGDVIKQAAVWYLKVTQTSGRPIFFGVNTPAHTAEFTSVRDTDVTQYKTIYSIIAYKLFLAACPDPH